MAIQRKKITAEDLNKLASDVNELFGDTHAGEGPSTDPQTQDDIRWGWGGDNVEYVQPKQKLTAAFTNELVNRINLSTYRTNSTDPCR